MLLTTQCSTYTGIVVVVVVVWFKIWNEGCKNHGICSFRSNLCA